MCYSYKFYVETDGDLTSNALSEDLEVMDEVYFSPYIHDQLVLTCYLSSLALLGDSDQIVYTFSIINHLHTKS